MARAKASVTYSPKLAQRILDELAGGATLTKVCKAAGMPSARAVNYWVDEDREGFAERYRAARYMGACVWVDQHKDEMDACDSEEKARILDAKTRGLRALIPVVAPTLVIEPAPPPQEHRISFDWGPRPALPDATRTAPMIEGQFREVDNGG